MPGQTERGDTRFEPLAEDHAAGLERFFERNAVPAVTATFDPFPLTAETARRLALEPGGDAFYVAYGGPEIIAFSMLRGFAHGFVVPSFGIFVGHEHMGKGLGRSLTEWTIEQARRRGCPAVRLTVYPDNVPAVSLYASLGFAEVERQPAAGRRLGTERIVMRLELDD